MSDSIHRLWQSTTALHGRFFPTNPPSFEARYRVFNEEVSELNMAVNEAEFTSEYEEYDPMHSPDLEAADVLVTAIGLLQYFGYSVEDFEQAIENVARKNDNKTNQTHEVNTVGKISKRR